MLFHTVRQHLPQTGFVFLYNPSENHHADFFRGCLFYTVIPPRANEVSRVKVPRISPLFLPVLKSVSSVPIRVKPSARGQSQKKTQP